MSLDQYSQNIILSSKELENEKQYWLEKLRGEIVLSAFPAGFTTKALRAEARQLAQYEFAPTLYDALKDLSKNSLFGIYMILLAACKYLLYRYTGSEDIIVAAPVFKDSGKTHFLNDILLLRTTVTGNAAFKDLLLEVKQTVTEADHHSHFPFAKLAELIGLDRQNDGTPHLKTIVLLEQIQDFHDSLKLRHRKADTVISFSYDTSLKLTLEYDPGLCNRELMEGIAGHFNAVLTAVTQNPNLELAAIDLLSVHEKKQLLSEFNNTATAYPKEKTMVELFEEQVGRTPEQIAVVFEGEKLTYRELSRKGNRLAHYLQNKGVGPDSIVGIMVERSIQMVIGILGALKAGGAYLPIDPESPEERIRFMLADSRVDILLAQNRFIGRYPLDPEVIDLEDSVLA
ncbi:MAG TPA: AMP-binding protein, partial [Bacillota bacterium]|nr:AMP-binding protein [Bacillota bacterium]